MDQSLEQCNRVSTDFDSNGDKSRFIKEDVHRRIRQISNRLKPNGIHTFTLMNRVGFKYTGDGDMVHCDTCGLEVSGWTTDMQPALVHAEKSPHCTFVQSHLLRIQRENQNDENPAKRQKLEANLDQWPMACRLMEVKKLKQIRRRTFSHWDPQIKPSAEQMIAAGFFACNIADRVICLYCHLICQQWSALTDDPSEVHLTLSPMCPFVLSILTNPKPTSAVVLNEISTNRNLESSTVPLPRFNEIVHTTPCHPDYSDMTKRHQTFSTWPQEQSPSVDELVRAGFFYTGARNIVTCFYCNGSLQNWGANDSPVIEHARWFQHCPYAKQLCGDELHRKIQIDKRARQQRDGTSQLTRTIESNSLSTSNDGQLQFNQPNMLSRYVAARLDLSVSQRLLDQNFKLSVIKRCWEDQLQQKHDDFVSDSDLLISCTILQEQIDHIQGNKNNIIVPSVRMKMLRESKQTNSLSPPMENTPIVQNQPVSTTPVAESIPTTSAQEQLSSSSAAAAEGNSIKNPSPSNPCIICCQDEKRLACIPCGHFTACVPCSHSLRACPICRREIEAFVRIYI